MLDIKQLKKELGISNKDLSEFFNMSYSSFANSTAKERYENALLSFYKLAKKAWEKNKTKKQISDNSELSDEKQLIIHGVVSSLPSEVEMLNGLNDIIEQKFNDRTDIEKLNFKKGFITYHHWMVNRSKK